MTATLCLDLPSERTMVGACTETKCLTSCGCAQVKYDTFVTVYMSDCDFYPRVRAAGFETLNYPQVLLPPDKRLACVIPRLL